MNRLLRSACASAAALAALSAAPAFATNVNGTVYCDVNVNGQIDFLDTGLGSGIRLTVPGVGDAWTGPTGVYTRPVPSGVVASYTISLDTTTLPADATLVSPNPQPFEITAESITPTVNWLVNSPSCRGSFCGDGVLDAGEACDDGNIIDGDGCSASCTVEAFCGDGKLDPGEQCDDGNTLNGDGCSAVCTVETGGQGCTPGYWKQSQHFDSYPAPYTPQTLFSDVFADAFPGMTLLQVLNQGGGGLRALGRHTVAALLNAASGNVAYDRSVDSIIESFNAAYAGTRDAQEHLKNVLEHFNEQGCPLN